MAGNRTKRKKKKRKRWGANVANERKREKR